MLCACTVLQDLLTAEWEASEQCSSLASLYWWCAVKRFQPNRRPVSIGHVRPHGVPARHGWLQLGVSAGSPTGREPFKTLQAVKCECTSYCCTAHLCWQVWTTCCLSVGRIIRDRVIVQTHTLTHTLCMHTHTHACTHTRSA